MNSIKKNKEIYDKKWAGANSFVRRYFVYECKEKIDSIKKLLRIAYKEIAIKKKNVLDIGFGDGNVLMLFKGNHVFGTEVSQVAIDNFKRLASKDIFLTIDIKEMTDDNRLLFQDKKMDIVILSHVLEHLEKPSLLLNEIKRVLRIDGFLFLLLPINELFYKHPGHFSKWDRSKIHEILEINGFRVEYYEENGNFENLTDMVMNIRNKFIIGALISFIVNIFLSSLPFRKKLFKPIGRVFCLKSRQLMLLARLT